MLAIFVWWSKMCQEPKRDVQSAIYKLWLQRGILRQERKRDRL